MTPLSEAVIQARGQGGERQVPDAEIVLVSGNGGILDFHSTLVLSTGPPLMSKHRCISAPSTADERSAPFFDASCEGRLLIHRCGACSHRYGPELRTAPPAGLPTPLGRATGDASLVSWVVVHRRDADGTPATTTVATAELPEGPWLTLPLDLDTRAAPSAGLAVQVGFVHPEGSETIPIWRLGLHFSDSPDTRSKL